MYALKGACDTRSSAITKECVAGVMEDDGASPSTSKTALAPDGTSTTAKTADDAKDDSANCNAEYLKSTLLTEVLNKKKMALMHSPEVVRFLQDKQRQKLKPNSSGNS